MRCRSTAPAAGFIASQPEPEMEMTQTATSVGLVVMHSLVDAATAMSTVATYLTAELVSVVLLLAVLEFCRSFLCFVLRITLIIISVFVAVVVYIATFSVQAASIMVGEPLDMAVACQQQTMDWMTSCLRAELLN